MFNYKINFIPSRFFVFGCGGTGSRLVPLLTQYIASCTWLKPFEPNIYLVDFDEVETKNLARQNFIARDVGSNKAEVLARRYSNAYGVPITSIPFKVIPNYKLNKLTPTTEEYQNARKSNDEFLSITLPKGENPYTGFGNSIVFICVDSIESRQDIVKFILQETRETPDTIIIDTGNENDFGQVKLSGIVSKLSKGTYTIPEEDMGFVPAISPVTSTLEALPFEYDYFQNMKPPAVKASCADLEQTMAINSMIANTAFSVLQNLLSGVDITAHRYNVSLSHGTSVEYYTYEKLLSMYVSEEDWSLNYPAFYTHEMSREMRSNRYRTSVRHAHWSQTIWKYISTIQLDFPEMMLNYVAPEVKEKKVRKPRTKSVEETATAAVAAAV